LGAEDHDRPVDRLPSQVSSVTKRREEGLMRRWLQFRVSTLLWLIVACAIAFGWWSDHAAQQRTLQQSELRRQALPHIPLGVRLNDMPFLMPIEGVFSIDGHGIVVTGKIEQGIVRTGDAVEIVGLADQPRPDVVTQVESFSEVLDVGQAGDNVG